MYQKNRLYMLMMLVVLGFFWLLSMPEARAETTAVPQEKETSGYADGKWVRTAPLSWTFTGKDIQWTFDASTKTLSFFGTGKMTSNGDSAQEVRNEKSFGYFESIDGMERGPWYIWREETEHIVIGEGITEIGDDAFVYFEHLIDVSLPDSLQVIGHYAFEESSIKSIRIPDGVKSIGCDAFAATRLKSITIPGGVKSIGGGAFARTPLSEITGMNGVKEFGSSVFASTLLEEFTFPQSLRDIGNYMLAGCKKLRKVTLSPNMKSIPGCTFDGCTALKEVKIPDPSLTQVGEWAFAYSCISSVKLPQSVVKVNGGAFQVTKFKTIELPKNVEVIGSYWADDPVFEGSKKLKTLKIKSKKLKKVYPNAFKKFPSKATIIVPKGKKKSYSKMFYKGGLSKKIKIKESKKW